MKFASSYEPNEYEADIYGAWEAANIFAPTIPTVPKDDDGDGVDDREEATGNPREGLLMPTAIFPSVMVLQSNSKIPFPATIASKANPLGTFQAPTTPVSRLGSSMSVISKLRATPGSNLIATNYMHESGISSPSNVAIWNSNSAR